MFIDRFKMWCIHTETHTLEYYSAIKKNEIRPFEATWMDLESVKLSEVRREIAYDIPNMWNLERNANELKKQKETHRLRK